MNLKWKRKKRQEKATDESWLIPYADILTLLLALFIVLYALSDVDAKKFRAMAQSFNEIFSTGTGIFDYPSPKPDEEAKGLGPQDKEHIRKNKGEKSAGPAKVGSNWNELRSVKKKIDAYIDENNLTDKLKTSLTDEGLLISISDHVLFDSGSARVRPADVKMAREISNLLEINPPKSIIISGHTDNVPINNEEFASNWELSVMRAVNFLKILLENHQLDPGWFAVKGYGEYQPVADNDTPEGRQRNRRVEILIVPKEASQ